jgi:hypothetical protein
MRRALPGLLVLALLAPALTAAATEYEDYRDTFESGGYSGNDGSLEFNGPWAESGDPGGGGAGGGLIHVGPDGCSGECLHIEGTGLVLAPYHIERRADLSLFEAAELCYDLEIDPSGLTTTELWVQVRKGSTWYTVKKHDLADETDTSVMIPISDYLTEGFKVRFYVPNALDELLGLNLVFTGSATVDNVTIRGIVEHEETTTTSTTSTSTTSTTSTSTTSTSAPVKTTTTTAGSTPTTTGSRPTTTTTLGEGADISTPGGSAQTTVTTTDAAGVTTTTVGSTSTTVAAGVFAPAAGPPPGSGLREPAVGLIADHRPGSMGSLSTDPVEVLGIELDVDFSLAVEVFEAARLWIAILVLLITAALVSGMERRRSIRDGV